MLVMSKHSSAPIDDPASNPLIRASLSWRSRSNRTRSSQSTAMVPYVGSPIDRDLTNVCRRQRLVAAHEAGAARVRQRPTKPAPPAPPVAPTKPAPPAPPVAPTKPAPPAPPVAAYEAGAASPSGSAYEAGAASPSGSGLRSRRRQPLR